MNKRSFKTIWNKARGMLVAVSEVAILAGASAGGTATAQIIADPSAPRSQQAVILPAGNGVPIVNIVTPTAGGVSMNQFSQFNVNNNGAILNNGRQNTQTQLGGWIQANPNLATGSASLIVNQVNSNNPTLLNGYIEVAGQRASVIIANPSGIQVNGAGFINAQSATLTTGIPNFNGNIITGYTVNQGTVQVSGAGLDASTTDYTAILARAAQINAGIWAKQLDVIAGANQINVASAASTPASISAATPTGAAPLFAIDVSSLGGMYAGKIMLIGTEAGVGARNTGTIMGVSSSLYAGAGEVTISVDGMLSNKGTIQSAGAMSVTAGSTSTGGISNDGTIYSGASSTITTNGNISNTATIAAQGNLDLTATGTSSTISSASGSVMAAGLQTDGSIVNNGANLNIQATQSVALNGQNLAPNNLNITATSINLSSSSTYASNISAVASTGAINAMAANIAASQNLILTTPTSLTTDNANVSGAQINLTATGNISNTQGLIRATGAATLRAANINNNNTNAANKGIEAGSLNITVKGAYNNANGSTRAAGDLTITVGDSTSTAPVSINNTGGNLSAGNSLTLTDAAATTGNNPAKTLAVTNTGGLIIAGSVLTIDAATESGDGKLNSLKDLNLKLSSSHSIANGSEIVSSGNTTITIAGTLTNRGLVDGVNTTIYSGNLNNLGTGRIYGDNVAIQTGTLTNDAEGGVAPVIAARNRLDIGAATVINNEHALLYSDGDMAIGSSLNANRQATGTATLIRNASATIEATGNLSLSATTTENLNNHFAVADLPYGNATSFTQVRATNTGNLFDVSNLTLAPCVGFSSTCYNAPSGEFIEDYTLLETTRTQIKTQVTSSDPGKISVGRNLTITGGDVLNSNSTVTVGGNLVVTGQNVVNQQASGNLTSTYSGTATVFSNHYEGGLTGCHCSKRDINGPSPYSTMDIQSINLSAAVSLYNTAPSFATTSPTSSAVSGNVSHLIASTTVNTKVSNNSLFKLATNPASRYLIETDPQFTNYKIWIGSDYLLAQLNLDPTTTQKRLGDAFYEQKLVREQVAALTGNRFLGNYTSDDEEYKALMDNAITVAKAFNLRPGIALTAEQVAQLTSDVVWLVETEVTLPDGTKTKALVPQVYVRLQPSDVGKDGQLLAGVNKQISANNIQMALTGNLTNTGTIAGRNLVLLNATNINNLGGSISGNNTLLIAKDDINNIGGSLSANNTLALQAGGDINVETTTSTSNGTSAGAGGTPNSYSNTIVNRVAGLYAGGNLVASAGGNISLLAAALSAGQNLTLTAVGNILMGTVTTSNQQYINLGGGNYINQSASSDVGTTVTAGNNITMQAGGVLVGVAANITGGGTVVLSGDGGVSLLAGYNTSSVETNITTGSKGLTSSQTNTLSQSGYQLATGTSVTGSNVQIVSKNGNITLQAANLNASNLLNLSAVNGTIDFASANQSSYASVATTGSSTLTQSASGSGQSTTNASFTQMRYGNISVAAKSVTIDMSANQSISALSTQPGMEWITQLQNDPALKDKINWNAINEAHKSWNYSQSGLSPAGAALMSIALAYATGGGASLNFLGGGAAMNAGFLTLATQASLAFANNGGDLGKALQSLGDSANVKGLLTSMLTAGAIQGLASTDFMQSLGGTTGASTFTSQLSRNLINAAATAVVGSAVNGTSLEEALKKGFISAIVATGSAQANFAIGQGTDPNSFANYMAHAIAGCVAGAAQASSSGGCSAGAIGGVVGEAAANAFNSGRTLDDIWKNGPLPDTAQFAGMMAAMVVAATGGSAAQIVISKVEGSSAAVNNQGMSAKLNALKTCLYSPIDCSKEMYATAVAAASPYVQTAKNALLTGAGAYGAYAGVTSCIVSAGTTCPITLPLAAFSASTAVQGGTGLYSTATGGDGQGTNYGRNAATQAGNYFDVNGALAYDGLNVIFGGSTLFLNAPLNVGIAANSVGAFGSIQRSTSMFGSAVPAWQNSILNPITGTVLIAPPASQIVTPIIKIGPGIPQIITDVQRSNRP